MKKDSKLFEIPLKALGKRIKAIREILELTRKNFANTLSFTPGIIRLYEQGEAKPGFEFFLQAIECFKINPYYLITGKGNMFINDGEKSANEIKKDGTVLDNLTLCDLMLWSRLIKCKLRYFPAWHVFLSLAKMKKTFGLFL